MDTGQIVGIAGSTIGFCSLLFSAIQHGRQSAPGSDRTGIEMRDALRAMAAEMSHWRDEQMAMHRDNEEDAARIDEAHRADIREVRQTLENLTNRITEAMIRWHQ